MSVGLLACHSSAFTLSLFRKLNNKIVPKQIVRIRFHTLFFILLFNITLPFVLHIVNFINKIYYSLYIQSVNTYNCIKDKNCEGNLLNIDDVIDTIGISIREIRKSKGMTQQKLADKADSSLPFINLIESNQRKVSIKSFNEDTCSF